jgi:hypothetical protein
MSVANSGLLPKPFIVKSYAITPNIGDQVDTDIFQLVVPALTAYSYSGNIAMAVLAAAGQSVVGGGLFTRNLDNSPIADTSPLYILNACVPQVLNPQGSPIVLTGFLYNPSSVDVTIKFTLNINVSGGVSSVPTAGLIYFYPIAVDGFRVVP